MFVTHPNAEFRSTRLLILSIFMMGLLVGVFLGSKARLPTLPMKVREINPEFRRNEVNEFYERFKAKQIIYQCELGILADTPSEVYVVESGGRADYGFMPISQNYHAFWITNNDIEIKKFNDTTLFVAMRTKFARTLNRH